MPWTLKPPPHGAGEFGIASCFLTGKRKEKFQAYRPLCKNNGEELSTLKELGKQGKNVLLSAESFSFITDIGALAEALEPWDVKVIYFHRWYHDWLLSNFNQASNSKLNRILANFDKFIADAGSGADFNQASNSKLNRILANFDKFIADAGSGAAKQKAKYNSLVNNFEKFYEEDFSMPDESYRSFYRYREHFDNVVALDYEDTRISLTEKFFCRGLKNETTGTCAEFLRQKESSGAGSTRINGAKTLAYKNIAYGANLLGVTSFCSKGHYDDVVAKIQHHHETTLGRSNTEFPTNCLKNVILEKLIEVSIEHRRNILPDVPFTEAEEKRIRSEFWSKMTEEKRGCDFDIAGVLALPEW
eukprot:CAMPEP_0183785024 /NCGR_PEP_ID=MMETSP0739-20130205/66291_1 /TAXON_ID=385413 /ORGANISM="Thalassiosira miniscula, Strain CCMP1093" /LENGTH=358 /DNA_ID=CAMNT_0026029017 /DNA_START=98 /DNA_END=1171 /DNA_ORIENTATION=-